MCTNLLFRLRKTYISYFLPEQSKRSEESYNFDPSDNLNQSSNYAYQSENSIFDDIYSSRKDESLTISSISPTFTPTVTQPGLNSFEIKYLSIIESTNDNNYLNISTETVYFEVE